MRTLLALVLLVVIGSGHLAGAEDPPSAIGAIMRLARQGKVPERNLATIIKMISERGNEHDLAFLLDQARTNKDLTAATRAAMLDGLIRAAQTRKLSPYGELAVIGELIAPSAQVDGGVRLKAIQLAGLWKVKSAAPSLKGLAIDAGTRPEVRQACLDALGQLSPEAARETVDEFLKPDQPFSIRAMGVAALAISDLDRAAESAAVVLKSAKERDDPGPIVDSFLSRAGGPDKLASALESSPPSTDVAKLCLRRLYAAGRSDPRLQSVLGKLAGIETNPRPLSPEQTAALIGEIQRSGDAARGKRSSGGLISAA